MFSLQRQIGDSIPHTAMKTRKCQDELINEFEKSLFNVEKHKNKKKQEGRFPGTLLAPSAVLLVQLVISSVVKGRGQR